MSFLTILILLLMKGACVVDAAHLKRLHQLHAIYHAATLCSDYPVPT